MADNAKLREIARAYAAIIDCCSFDYCPYEEDCDAKTAPMRNGCKLYEELRELGVLDE